MKIAAIADIHGNHLALNAVLHDIKKQNIKTIVNLGDHFSGPLTAGLTAEILLESNIHTIRGNHDRYLIERSQDKMGPSDSEAYKQLKPEHLKWLEDLPATMELNDEFFLCHGIPGSDTTYFLEHVEENGTARLADKYQIENKLGTISHPVILCGHTHIPRIIRLSENTLIVNPGSVGCPAYTDKKPYPHTMQTGTTHACYAIMEKENNIWNATFRYVPYDHKKMAEIARNNLAPQWEEALRTGWITRQKQPGT